MWQVPVVPPVAPKKRSSMGTRMSDAGASGK
jgi:hypothetical protein